MEEYDKHGIFTWNSNNLLYSNDNNIYNNVYLHTGTVIKCEWENPIGITKTDDNSIKVISNTNHFLHGPKWGPGYNSEYKIFDNLVKNYLYLKNVNDENTDLSLFNDDTYFYMLDTFSFSNSGHNLSNVLNMIKYIIDNNIQNILIYKNYKNTNNFKLISLLLPNCNYIELNVDTVYKIKNIIIIYPEIFNIKKYPDLIMSIKNKIIEGYSEIFNNCKNKNIILMKTNRNKNVMLKISQIHCEKMLLMLEQEGYIILIPEEIDIFQLCIYIMYANKIIFSNGSVIYTNKIFINKTSKLFAIDYPTSYKHCYSDLENITFLYYKNNYLTDAECKHFYDKIINN
jgi:hypothetical protein